MFSHKIHQLDDPEAKERTETKNKFIAPATVYKDRPSAPNSTE